MKISIIIPVYNTEKYLSQCLESIINQTYKDIEIIIINDGSTDNSRMICMQYKNKDNRIKYFEINNSGVSFARNFGIEKSEGEYIMFVDSDDFLEVKALELIAKHLKENDLLIYGYDRVYKNRKVKQIENSKEINLTNLRETIFNNDNIGGYLCNKIFRVNIIKDNSMKFDENIHYCEDLIFVSQYVKYVKNVFYIKEVEYHYRMRKSSATFNSYSEKNLTILDACEKMLELNSDDEYIQKLLAFKYLNCYYKFDKKILKNKKINYDIKKKEKLILRDLKIKGNKYFKYILNKRFRKIYVLLQKLKYVLFKLYL